MDAWWSASAATGAAPPPASAPPAAPPPAAAPAAWGYNAWGTYGYGGYAPSVANSYAAVAARTTHTNAYAAHASSQAAASATAAYNAQVRAQWPTAAPAAAAAATAPTYAAAAARAKQPPAPPSAAPAKAGAKTMDGNGWPPSLRDYVERAFARARNDTEKHATEEQLKEVIQTAIHANLLWTRDWRAYPLPALPQPPPLPAARPPPPPPPTAAPPPPPPAAASSYSGYQFSHAAPAAVPSFASTAPKARPVADPSPGDFVPLGAGAARKEKKPKVQLSEPDASKAKRAKRFGDAALAAAGTAKARKQAWRETPTGGGGGGDDEAWAGLAIRGTSQELEKQYLRLTAPPDPATVRPLPVLRNALALVKRKWKASADYAHACEQLKSIRQDMTVQAIKEDFSAEVYEVHARLALENRDLSEFNQCQTQLFDLYTAGVRTASSSEFLAYRVLYFVHRAAHSDLARLLVQLEPAARRQPAVAHALAVHRALLSDNFTAFFRLYVGAPNMSAYLMDLFLDQVRRAAYRILAKACRPSVPLAWLQAQLAFEELAECADFMRAQGGTLSPDGTELLCK